MKHFVFLGLALLSAPLVGQDVVRDVVGGDEDVVLPKRVKVEYRLDRIEARRNEAVVLRLSILTRVRLRALAFALDFDESRITVDEVRPSRPEFDAILVADLRSRIEWDSADREPGNQLREGWVFAKVESAGPNMDIGIPIGSVVPILDIYCRVRGRAARGFSPITFRTLDVQGPNIGEEAYDNRYEEIAEVDQPIPAAVEEENLNGGGIEIIGEVGFFTRGDANFDGSRNISDPVYTLRYLFQQGAMACSDAADANDDSALDISDPVFTLLRMYTIGGAFPEPNKWGPDPTDDDLGCEIYTSGSGGN